jgi:hypothetical protein
MRIRFFIINCFFMGLKIQKKKGPLSITTKMKLKFIRNYRFYVATLKHYKFPKGMYIYRKQSEHFSLIPKGFYVKNG